MDEGNNTHFRRAGDPSDHAAERAALRQELGMGSVRAPLPLDVDRLVHEHPTPPHPTASGDALMDLIAHHQPPVPTHLVDGALEEHARHEREARGPDVRPD
jgi:hypothetical protein